MATKDFIFYLYYVEKHSTPEEPFFTLTSSAGMEEHGYTLIRKETVTVEVPDVRDLTEQRLAALDDLEAKTRAAFARQMMEIATRRQSLLALPNEVEA